VRALSELLPRRRNGFPPGRTHEIAGCPRQGNEFPLPAGEGQGEGDGGLQLSATWRFAWRGALCSFSQNGRPHLQSAGALVCGAFLPPHPSPLPEERENRTIHSRPSGAPRLVAARDAVFPAGEREGAKYEIAFKQRFRGFPLPGPIALELGESTALFSLSSDAGGGEGRGEESRFYWISPLPNPPPARSSQGEGDRRWAFQCLIQWQCRRPSPRSFLAGRWRRGRAACSPRLRCPFCGAPVTALPRSVIRR